MTAAAGCKLSMGSANAEPGPAGRRAAAWRAQPPAPAAAGSAQWSGAVRKAARSRARSRERIGAEPGAAGGRGSGSTAADRGWAEAALSAGKNPFRILVKTCTKKNHCINIPPKKGKFALTPSTASSFVAIYSMRQSNLEKIHLSSLTTFWCDFRELYCLFMWNTEYIYTTPAFGDAQRNPLC
ncbi:uncharacterized protein LOC110362196 isoform X2 [Columba livia]|uniref:uncharacterized protein LOC110362196 isoform X2 n=1 Tax=Columba livia TaxID=8932 RepID=UPI0031BAF8BF